MGHDAQVVVGQSGPEKSAGLVGELLAGALPQDGAGGPKESHPLAPSGAGRELVHPPRTFLLDRLGHVAVERGRGCAGACAEGENVGVGETHLLDETQSFFKVGLRLAGKADDQICRDGQVGDGGAGIGYQPAKAGDCAAPGHAPQLGVGTGLQREVQVRAQAIGPALPQVEEAVGQLPGFEAAEPQAGDVGLGENSGRQLLEVGAAGARQVPAVGAEMDSSQDCFAVAARDQGLDLLHDISGCPAAALSAQSGNDAEGAPVLAAVLHLDKGARAAAVFVRRGGREGSAVGLKAYQVFRIGELCAPGLKQRMQHLLGLVIGHELDAWKLGGLFRRQGCVAAGHSDAGVGVAIVQAPGGLPALARGLGRDRAGVEHDDMRFLRTADDVMTGGVELARQCVIFAEVKPAAQLVEKHAHRRRLTVG